MNPFEPTGPEVPPAPIEIPTPSIPAANFQTIGADLEKGRLAALGAIKGAPGWFDWIFAIVAKIIGGILNVILDAIAILSGILYKTFEQADEGMSRIAAVTVNGLLGQSDTAGDFASVVSPQSRAGIHSQVAAAIISGIGGDLAKGGAGSIKPGSAGRDRFLTTASNLAIEGWLSGWLFELASVGQVETFAELKDIMARVMGFGRIAHTMLHPLIKLTAVDPQTHDLNNTFRPKLWGEADGIHAYWSNQVDLETLKQHLAWQGYSDDQIGHALVRDRTHLTIPDIASLLRHNQLADTDSKPFVEMLGYNETEGLLALQVVENAESDRLYDQLLARTTAAYVERKIDLTSLQAIINATTLPQPVKDLHLTLAQIEQGYNIRRISVGEADKLVKEGIWNFDDRATLYQHYGYSLNDIQDTELLLALEMKTASDLASAKATAAAARKSKAAAAAAKLAAEALNAANIAESKGVSVAQFSALVMDGLKTIVQYENFLKGKGLAADNIAALSTVLQNKLNAAGGAAGVVGAAGVKVKARNLSLGQLEAGYIAGHISLEEYTAHLEAAGVSAEDTAVLLDLANDKLAVRQAKEGILAGAAAHAVTKGVSLAEELAGVKQGLVSTDDYGAYLAAHGFTEEAVTLLVSEAKDALASAKSAAAVKAGIGAGLAGKGISLSQLERAVRAGVSTVSDYAAALAAAGYEPAAVTTLVGLLQSLVDRDRVTAQTRSIAAASLASQGIAIADLERGVRLGVVPIATYQEVLTVAGVPAAAQQTLTLNLAAQIKQVKAAQSVAARVRQMVGATGLSLATLEKNVYSGKLSIEQFTNEVTAAGVSPADAQTVLGLVQDELAQVNSTSALLGAATTAAAGKKLSLAQETAAVHAGVKPLTDYSAFVAALGFNAADVATLTATVADSPAYQKLVAAGTAPAFTG